MIQNMTLGDVTGERPALVKHTPERMCIVTRAKMSPEVMIRFVLGPDHDVVPDLRRKLPGRGVWVGAQAALVKTAMKKNAFKRAFKTEAKVSATLADDLDALMEKSCLQALAFANKAGQVIAGFAKVEAALANDPVICLVHAKEAGADGIRKLGQVWSRRCEGKNISLPAITVFNGDQLDLALGRHNITHMVVKAGGAGASFFSQCQKLEAYRADILPDRIALASDRKDRSEDIFAPGLPGKSLPGEAGTSQAGS